MEQWGAGGAASAATGYDRRRRACGSGAGVSCSASYSCFGLIRCLSTIQISHLACYCVLASVYSLYTSCGGINGITLQKLNCALLSFDQVRSLTQSGLIECNCSHLYMLRAVFDIGISIPKLPHASSVEHGIIGAQSIEYAETRLWRHLQHAIAPAWRGGRLRTRRQKQTRY